MQDKGSSSKKYILFENYYPPALPRALKVFLLFDCLFLAKNLFQKSKNSQVFAKQKTKVWQLLWQNIF